MLNLLLKFFNAQKTVTNQMREKWASSTSVSWIRVPGEGSASCEKLEKPVWRPKGR